MKLLEYYLISAVVFVLHPLPTRFLEWCARRVADTTYFFMGRRQKIGIENLTRAFGDKITLEQKKKILRHSLQHAVITVMELLIVRRIIPNKNQHYKLVNNHFMDDGREKGKGVILVISHLGSWEMFCMYPSISNNPSSVIVKNLKNPYLTEKLNGLREKMGTTAIPKDGAALKKTLATLKKNEVGTILIDQWAGPDGIWTPFFGDMTSTTSLPGRLSLKTGAPIVFGVCIRKSHLQFEIEFSDPVKTDREDPHWERKATEALDHALEEKILQYPEQWNWLHKRWKPKPHTLREL